MTDTTAATPPDGFDVLDDGPGRWVLVDHDHDDPAPVYPTREEAVAAAWQIHAERAADEAQSTTPPAAGDVREHVAWLRELADDLRRDRHFARAKGTDAAAAALERLAGERDDFANQARNLAGFCQQYERELATDRAARERAEAALRDASDYLDAVAYTLDRWAAESRAGGWSTHQVGANIEAANNCRREAAKARAALQPQPHSQEA